MIIFYFALLILMLYKVKIKAKSFNQDYLSKSNTCATRGIFAILIFLRHVYSYFKLDDIWVDTWFKSVDRFLGQGIVCLFLFYTGYGIYESLKKNENYFDTFLENRILKTLVSFDLAILLYWLVQVTVLKKFIDLKTLVTALIGLSSLGNSNWYMFYIFIAYIIAFISFRLCKKHGGILLTLALTIGYVLYASKSNFGAWWYDTALCVPLGMVYSCFKEKLEKLLFNNNLIYYTITLLTIALWIGSTLLHLENKDIIVVIFSRLTFTLAYIFVSMKITFNNGVLTWLGTYSFAIYIIQRIPMLILQKYYLPDMNKYIFVVISLILTLVLAYLFNLLAKAVEKLLFAKKSKIELI